MQTNDSLKAAQAMEAMVLRQLIDASGIFRGGDSTGSHVRADTFAQTLAEVVAKGGGLGITAMLQRDVLGSTAAQPGAFPVGDHRASITSPYGERVDPLNGSAKFHHGVDIAAPQGSAIVAAEGGVVESSGKRGGYGMAVEIRHPDGSTTLYAHASRLAVQAGDRVEAGQRIADVGQTGRSTGPHLHFEKRVNGLTVNPEAALNFYRQRADIQRSGEVTRGGVRHESE